MVVDLVLYDSLLEQHLLLIYLARLTIEDEVMMTLLSLLLLWHLQPQQSPVKAK
jgi:hypothetical protein